MQALFVLAFVLSLREAARNPAWRELPLRFVPAALIAVGSVYAYSYPGLIWLAAAAAIWSRSGWRLRRAVRALRPGALARVGLALLAFVVLVAPEVGRMIEFHNFETFDPNGPGLGNLFGQISPFEALGIWPSGDFRLAPGRRRGAGVRLLPRRRLRRDPARLRARPLLAAARDGDRLRPRSRSSPSTRSPASPAPPTRRPRRSRSRRRSPPWSSSCRCCAARSASSTCSRRGGCSLLALANAPVGPTAYSPALTGLRPLVAAARPWCSPPTGCSTRNRASRYIAWELRGGRVCIEPASEAPGRDRRPARRPPAGVRFVVTEGGDRRAALRRPAPAPRAGPYLLWETTRPPRGQSDCPLIAVRQARQGPAR